MIDIIPDIHGHADKLTGLLAKLGYRQRKGAWRHSNPTRSVVFLGDFIDRGPENAKVILMVRNMIDAGTAQAILGNHELNAIHYHTAYKVGGDPLRPHTLKNQNQHGSFLAEFPVQSAPTKQAISWMKTLPCFLDFGDFRVVHACWSQNSIKTASAYLDNGLLSDSAVQHSANPQHPLYKALETILKGPDAKLPDGLEFTDKNGDTRDLVRLAWWRNNAKTWREAAISVPDPNHIPDTAIDLRP